MFEKMLCEKSSVEITNNKWVIDTQFSDYNQCGTLGKNDLIKRQDAVRLLGEMNIKLSQVYREAKKVNPKLADELLQAHTVLSYAMWGLREMESAAPSENTAVVKVDEFGEK